MSQAVILYASIHHQNTLKLVRAVAERIHADTVDLLNDAQPDLTGYSCVFLASGIYFNTLHRSLLDFIGRTAFDGKKVCILYTCGLRYRDYAKPAAQLLAGRARAMRATSAAGGLIPTACSRRSAALPRGIPIRRIWIARRPLPRLLSAIAFRRTCKKRAGKKDFFPARCFDVS